MTATLESLQTGQHARVQDVQGDDSLALRIMEMGLLPGAEIELIGRAPLGDPLEIRVAGYHLSLRKAEAHRVVIEMI